MKAARHIQRNCSNTSVEESRADICTEEHDQPAEAEFKDQNPSKE